MFASFLQHCDVHDNILIPIAFPQMNFGDVLRSTMPRIRPHFICITENIFNTFYLMYPVIATVLIAHFGHICFFISIKNPTYCNSFIVKLQIKEE